MTDLPEAGGRGLLGAVDSVLRPIENLAAIMAGAITIAMMVLVAADAFLRYAFNAPLVFQYTLTEQYLLVALIMLALPWGFRTGGYIRIMGLANKLPPNLLPLLLRAGLLASFAFVAVLAWKSAQEFWDLFQSGETRIGTLPIPVYLSWITVPIGCGLLALRLLLTALGPEAELHVEEIDGMDEI